LHVPGLLIQLVLGGNWGWWRQLRPGLGFPLLLVLVGWWVLAAGIATNWVLLRDMVVNHFLIRGAGPLLKWLGWNLQDLAKPGGQDAMHAYARPPGFYLALVWVTFWPWCLLLIPAGFHVVRRVRGRTVVAIDRRPYQFLLAWIVPMWIVLELARGKLMHYVLPLYVPMIILCADTLVQSWHRLTDVLAARWFRAAKWAWLLIWLALAGVALAGPRMFFPPAQAEHLGWLAMPLAGALLALGVAGTIAWNRPAWPFVTVLGFGAALLWANTVLVPEIPQLSISKTLMAEAGYWRARGFVVGAVGYQEPTLIFYSRQQVLPLYGSALEPEVMALFGPGAKHLVPVQERTESYASANQKHLTDATQATVLVVDQPVLEQLDAAGVRYYVITRVTGLETGPINAWKLWWANWTGGEAKTVAPLRAALIANVDPQSLNAAGTPATSQAAASATRER
jgi:4-amino-4-deoxy-L-arabinose transferase-like glycosyltransferase